MSGVGLVFCAPANEGLCLCVFEARAWSKLVIKIACICHIVRAYMLPTVRVIKLEFGHLSAEIRKFCKNFLHNA